MNGVHDMGGMDGFGPVIPEANVVMFHHLWEGRTHALTMATPAGGNIDSGRHQRELIPPAEYLAMSYYERWFRSLTQRLLLAGLVTQEELATGRAAASGLVSARPPMTPAQVQTMLIGRGSYQRDVEVGPAFAPGDEVRALNLNPTGHTRLPRYVRGKVGVIERCHGTHVFPDSNAHHLGEDPRPLYGVRFSAQTLWGQTASARDNVCLDLWEPYLERA